MLNKPTLSAGQSQLPLRELGDAIEALIALYDAADGDPELEPCCSEDDAVLPPWWGDYRGEGAGCPISDPGGCEHDGREEDVGQ
jgi:hypothetical protein